MTIEKWFYLWLKEYGDGDIKKSTVGIYDGYIRNYISPKIGKMELSDLTAQKLQQLYDEELIQNKISAKTLRNINSMIHRSLKKAVRLEIIDKNPSDYVELPQIINKEIDIITDEEEAKLKNAIKDEEFGIGILVALYTGLRLGELLGLKWCSLDFDKRILRVTHSLGRQAVQDGVNMKSKTILVLQEPKTQNSKREIPLNKLLVEELIEYKKRQQEKYGFNINLNRDFILSKKYMNPVDPRSFQNFFIKILKKAEIRKVKFHSLRHKFASKAIETGVSDKVTSKLLGHSDVTTTLNIYTHISDEMRRSVIEKM